MLASERNLLHLGSGLTIALFESLRIGDKRGVKLKMYIIKIQLRIYTYRIINEV